MKTSTDMISLFRVTLSRSLFYVFIITIALMILAPLLPTHVLSYMIAISIFSIYAIGYDLLFGYTNQTSLGHSLFFGVGAYGFLLSVLHLKTDFWGSLAIGLFLSFILALIIGIISVRLSESYFVIVTAIFSNIFYSYALNATWLTGGSDGLTIKVPTIYLGNISFSVYDPVINFYFSTIVLVFAYFLLKRIVDSPLGRVFIALGQNQERLTYLGYNIYRYKLLAFIISGVFTGLSGILYCIRLRYASAEFFGIIWSILPIIWCLIGGRKTLLGPCIGVIIFTFFQFYISSLWTHYLIFFGLLIIILFRFSPIGIVGYINQRWGRQLHENSRNN